MQNYFDLFELPEQFTVDVSALEIAYRVVQTRVHPDKFVGAADADKRAAVQWASYVNQAYTTLKNPQKRAVYLCELHGVEIKEEQNTAMPTDFLMQQMMWREAVEEAELKKDSAALIKLEQQLKKDCQSQIAELSNILDERHFTQAVIGVRKLMFLEKLLMHIGDVMENLDEV